MSDDDDETPPSATRHPFPHSRSRPAGTPGGYRDLGLTPLARQLQLSSDQTNGHWCSRCQGIWFGCALEVECPKCGNRKG